MTTSSVGVLICVRDCARYIEEAVDSALAQTIDLAEVLVVDDGSTDGSGSLALARGARVVVQGPLGLGVARNRGFRESSAELVVVIDADDLLLPDSVERLVNALQSHPEAIGARGLMRQFVSPELDQSLAERTGLVTGLQPCVVVGGAVWRRSQVIGTAFNTEEAATDVDWIARVRESGWTIAALDEEVLRRRVHTANTSLAPHFSGSYLRIARAAIGRRRAAAT